jgi:hypothetical protein
MNCQWGGRRPVAMDRAASEGRRRARGRQCVVRPHHQPRQRRWWSVKASTRPAFAFAARASAQLFHVLLRVIAAGFVLGDPLQKNNP